MVPTIATTITTTTTSGGDGRRALVRHPAATGEPMTDTSFLKDLILLRNDPSKVPAIREAAVGGNVHAQYALGLVYAEGRGVPIDLAQAHYWLTLAIEQGDRDADLLRNIVGARMTDEEFAAALRLRAGPGLRLVEDG